MRPQRRRESEAEVTGRGAPRDPTITGDGLDKGIKTRWANTGYTRTSQMTAKFTGEGHWSRALPKLANGKSICLNWSCKGKCRKDCERFESHKPMGPRLVPETNECMDQCQVARA